MNELGTLLTGVGTIAIGWMALTVHRVVGEDRTIDRRVVQLMRRERMIGYTGLALILIGTILQLAAR